MRHILLLLALITILYSTNTAQRRGGNHRPQNGLKSVFSGTVTDENGEAIPFANVTAYRSRDSSLAGGTATNEIGFYKLELRPGNYFLKYSFLSYETQTIYDVTLSHTPTMLRDIKLKIKTELLDEVEITADRSQMELKLDKRVFNIEKDLANTGANAAEILDNIPSVQVDVEGNISLRGSENVRVLIDGKPSTLTGGSTADVLRQFQGSMIEKVEVITNPSARYDAEGEVGIINIVLKKEKRTGLNGSIEAVAGYPDNYRASFNLNYRTKKANFFTAYGISYRDSPGAGNETQTIDNPDTTYSFESESERSRRSLGNNFRLGTDIYFNKYNSITVAGLYRFSDQLNKAELEYRDLDSNSELFQKVIRTDNEDETGENIEGNFNYTKLFKQKDRKFTVDFRWSQSDDLEESNIVQNNFRNGDQLIQKTSNTEVNRTILSQTDYIHPLGKNRIIEGGIRSTIRTAENKFQVLESNNGSEFVILDRFNNDFGYIENVLAGYIQFGNEIKKFSYQLGLRAELSDITSELKVTNTNFNQEYFNFFPSAFFTYKYSKTKQLQLSYSRRINRPSYRHLLPFQTFSDNRNLWRGNPNLKPEYTDSYELGYLKYFKKGSLFSSIYYRYRTNVVDRIITTNNLGFTERLPVNLAVENNVGFEFNGSYRFSKKLSFNANFNLYREDRKGEYLGQKLENEVITWSSRGSLKMEILPKVDFQASFRYRAPQQTTQGSRKSMYWLDLSAGKDVLKGKGTIVASVRDVFNSRKRRSKTETATLYSESEFQWRARQFLLTFSYRINQKKKRGGGKSREDFGGGDDF